MRVSGYAITKLFVKNMPMLLSTICNQYARHVVKKEHQLRLEAQVLYLF